MKVDDRLKELEGVNTFTDFVQAFSQFGSDMVELAHLSGDRQNVSTCTWNDRGICWFIWCCLVDWNCPLTSA